MKNHKFLLEVFFEVVKRQENSILLLLGEGECMEEIRILAKEKKLEEKVLFLGNKRNIQDYYQAMDVFVFPSIFDDFQASSTVIRSNSFCNNLGVNLAFFSIYL